MIEKPMLFSTPMVQALLRGDKTQTRRIVKPQPENGTDCPYHVGQGESRVARKIPYPVGSLLVPAMLLSGYDVKYCADILGRLWSKSSGEWRLLKPSTNSGYPRCTMRQNKRDINQLVHRVVCEAWHGKPVKPSIVRHLNGDRLDNQPNNLDWGTYEQNWDDRKVHRAGINETHHAAKLNWDTVRYIRASGQSAWTLAQELGLNSKTVARVISGETWREKYNETPPNCQRWCPPIWLKVTDVRVERIQDISEEDAKAEGCRGIPGAKWRTFEEFDRGEPMRPHTDRDVFSAIWQSTYPGSWERNDWVWVYEFERTPQPLGNPSERRAISRKT